MVYSIIPRSLDTAGIVRWGKSIGLQQSDRSKTGMRSVRAKASRFRKILEISWEGVHQSHLSDLDTLLDTTLGSGIVVCPTFQAEGRVTSAIASSGSVPRIISLSDVSAFQGWSITITDSVNDRLDFINSDGGSELTASITPGNYSPFLLATEITTAMNTASGGAGNPSYEVGYSYTEDRFYIQEEDNINANDYLDLLLFSGTNAGRSVMPTIGFDSSKDRTGATLYYSDYFKAPYGNRIVIANAADKYQTKVLNWVSSVDTGNNTITVNQVIENDYSVNSVVEPIFNASIVLPEEDGEMAFSWSSPKGRKGIVDASIKFVEEFNA